MATIDAATVRFVDVAGVRDRRIGIYTGPAVYVAGGDSLTPNEVKLGEIEFLIFEHAINGALAIRSVVYDTANQKVVWIVPSTGVEVAPGVDLSGFQCRFEAVGK